MNLYSFQNMLVIVLVIIVASANSLEIKSVREGTCLRDPPDPRFNITWLSTVPNPLYFVAGSKYNMYQIISGHPEFDQMREFEFYYDACVTSVADFSQEVGVMYGFGGRTLARMEFRPYTQHGILDMTYTPVPPRPGLRSYFLHHRITLTDNESFVFFHNCWEEAKQRGWSVVSTKPVLDRKTRRLVEEHAASLGYDSRQMIFFNRETCQDRSRYRVEEHSSEWRRARLWRGV